MSFSGPSIQKDTPLATTSSIAIGIHDKNMSIKVTINTLYKAIAPTQ